MNKPNEYDTTSAGGFTPATLGGHICRIKDVRESLTKDGRSMIIVRYDFDKSDVQPGYYTDLFRDDIRPNKKWPHLGTAYIPVEDASGKCTKLFKQFTTSFAKSNDLNDDAIVWGEAFADQFKEKLIGAVYGEAENEYNGKVTTRHERRWFCDSHSALDAEIPAKKYLDGHQDSPVRPGAQTDVFAPVVDEDLPFA